MITTTCVSEMAHNLHPLKSRSVFREVINYVIGACSIVACPSQLTSLRLKIDFIPTIQPRAWPRLNENLHEVSQTMHLFILTLFLFIQDFVQVDQK